MKNFVLLGLVSLLLFSVAAGLSVWLQQSKSKEVAEEKAAEQGTKKGLKEDTEKPNAEKTKTKPEPVPPKGDGPLSIAAEVKDERAALKRREIRFEKEKAQQVLVLEDLRVFREEVERLNKRLSDEEKRAVALAAVTDPVAPAVPTAPVPPPPFAAARPTTPPKVDPNEQKNTERLAVMYESMPPETAAKLFQEMADSGKMDNAVKVLVQMRERQAGKVIAEIPDRTLAAQLVDRILEFKRPTAGK